MNNMTILDTQVCPCVALKVIFSFFTWLIGFSSLIPVQLLLNALKYLSHNSDTWSCVCVGA